MNDKNQNKTNDWQTGSDNDQTNGRSQNRFRNDGSKDTKGQKGSDNSSERNQTGSDEDES